jgi:hypothetical protein
MHYGMGRKVAGDLIARFSSERIQRNILLLQADPRRIKNPPAWLRTAIEEDYAGRQAEVGADAEKTLRPSDSHLTPTPGGRRESEERAARGAAMYLRLAEPDRQAMRQKAERELREDYAQFGPGARVGEGAILARIYEWLLADDKAGDAVAAPTPTAAPLPYPPAQIAAQFFRWYARRHRTAGADITVPLRAPSAVRARRIAWAVMQAFKASLREIGSIAGVDKTTVQYGLRQVQHRPDERVEADRWQRQFLEALEDFTWPEPSHTP